MSIEQHIMVVGAGVSGLTTAIYSKLAGYRRVTCADKYSGPCAGNSGIIAQAHSGIEYPGDPKTGVDCLKGLMEFMQCLPPEIFVGGCTRVLIAKQKEELIEVLHKHIFEVLSVYYKDHGHEYNYNLGDPDTAFRTLNPEEFSDAKNVIAGFVTPQRTINSVVLATILHAFAEDLGVEFLFEHEVTNIKQYVNAYQITCKTNTDEVVTIDSDFIALTAYDRNTRLAKMINPDYFDGNLAVGLRVIPVVVRKSECPDPNGIPESASFTLKDQYGGMDAPVSRNCRIIYLPSKKAGHASDPEPLAAMKESWAKELIEALPKSERADRTISGLSDNLYPWLGNFKVAGSYRKFVLLDEDKDIDKRPNRGPRKVADGAYELIAMKATYCIYNAKEIVTEFLKHTLSLGSISREGYDVAIASVKSGKVLLANKYQGNPAVLESDARAMARRINLPDEFVGSLSADVPQQPQAIVGYGTTSPALTFAANDFPQQPPPAKVKFVMDQ